MKNEKLIEKIPHKQGYTINLSSGPLFRDLVKELYNNKFIPDSLI